MLASDFVKEFDVMLDIQFHAFVPPQLDRPAKYGKFVIGMKNHIFVNDEGATVIIQGRGDSVNAAFADWCASINAALKERPLSVQKRRKRAFVRAAPREMPDRLMPNIDLAHRMPKFCEDCESCDSR